MHTKSLLILLWGILGSVLLDAQSFENPTIDLSDATIDPGETFCLDLTAYNLQETGELRYNFSWKWRYLAFQEVIFNGAMAQNETFVQAFGPRDEEASLTVHWQGSEVITGDTLLLQLCFEGNSPGRSSVEYYGTGAFDSLINLVSGFVNVGNVPRKIREYHLQQSDFTVTERMSFEIDPFRISELTHVSQYSFDLIYDTTLLALDLDNFYFGTNSRNERRIVPLEKGYRIIWPTNTHGTSNYQAIFPYRLFFKSKEVIDTTARIYADNFKIVNGSRDSFQISSDTALIFITDRIRRKTPVRIASGTKSIPVDETGQVPYLIDELVQLKKIDLELWNGREYEILDAVSSKLNQNGQFQVTTEGNKTRVMWANNSPVSFAKGDTLFNLEVRMNGYETGEEIPLAGAEFLNEADKRMPLSPYPQATVKTPGYPSKEIDLTSDYIWASPGDTIRVHSSLYNDEQLFNLLRSFKYDYYWDNLVLKLLAVEPVRNLYDMENATIIPPWESDGHPGKIQVDWCPENLPDDFIGRRENPLNIFECEFEVIGEPGSATGLSYNHYELRADRTDFGAWIQFSPSLGYVRIVDKEDMITVRLDTSYSTLDEEFFVDVMISGLDSFSSMNISLTFPKDQMEFMDYSDLNNELPGLRISPSEDENLGTVSMRLSFFDSVRVLNWEEEQRLLRLSFRSTDDAADDCFAFSYDQFWTSFTSRNAQADYIELPYRVLGTDFCYEIGTNNTDVESAGLEIFPNPATDQVTLTYPDDLQVEKIYLRDLSGRIIQEWDGRQEQLEVRGLQGLYFLELISTQGSIVEKLVVLQD